MNDIKFIKEMCQDLISLSKNKRLINIILKNYSKNIKTEINSYINVLRNALFLYIIDSDFFANNFIANLPEGIICKRHSKEARAVIFSVEGTDFDTNKIEVTKKEKYIVFHPKGKPVSPEKAKWVVKFKSNMPLLLPIPR